MRAIDVIAKKRDFNELSTDEIKYFIDGFTRGDIPDYQAAAFAMAVLLNGMTARETTDLTLAMANSGRVLDLSSIAPNSVDKHSTGGVGDKTSLVVEPMIASCGLPIAKMSGRGLGFTGGTLDKLESIPGYRVDLNTQEFLSQLLKIGLVLSGQSADLAPADGKLYALRDATATVESIPLIASSIMSKKIAAGAQAMVLDVKVGKGAFMKTLEEAEKLAQLLVEIALLAGRKAVAIISDMNQPLGFAVGNSLEVCEAIDTLRGFGPPDFREHCFVIAGHILALAGIAVDENQGRKIASETIKNQSALDKFRLLVESQGGDVLFVDQPDKFPRANIVETIVSKKAGFVAEINALLVGEAAVLLGAGRAKKEDIIDHAVGIIIHRKVGDQLEAGDKLYTIHANQSNTYRQVMEMLDQAHQITSTKTDPLPLFYGIVRG